MQRLISGCILLILLSGVTAVSAGNFRPVAFADKKTVKIGEPFQVSVFVDYPCEFQLLFPDSTFAFGNCTLKERRFFPTRSGTVMSRDCVVYQLASFNPEPFQAFRIPVIRFENGDSTRFYSNEIRFRIQAETDSAAMANPVFRSETNPVLVPLMFNYPWVAGIAALIVSVLLLANFFLDKPIQRFFYLWIERRRHLRYLKTFRKLQESLMKEASVQRMESIVLLWKQYLQRINGKPFLSYTSLEIAKELPDPLLKKTLQEIDRWIYGGMKVENLNSCVERLKEKSLVLYEIKRDNIRNGKLGKAI
jgi:hypothetical protein